MLGEADLLTHPMTLVVVGCLLTAALGWLGHAIQKVLSEVRDLRVDLVTHMGNAETLRSADLAERVARQEANDQRIGQLEGAVQALRGDVKDATRELHGRIDDALGALAAGNPEVRR